MDVIAGSSPTTARWWKSRRKDSLFAVSSIWEIRDLWIDRYYRFNWRLFPREITRRFRENRAVVAPSIAATIRFADNWKLRLRRTTVIWPVDRYPRGLLFSRLGKAEVTEHLHDNFEIRSDPSELMTPGSHLYDRCRYAMRYAGVVERESRKRFDDRHGKNYSIP